MSERAAVTKPKAEAYTRADRARKQAILDVLVERDGWHRGYAHARRATTELTRNRRGTDAAGRLLEQSQDRSGRRACPAAAPAATSWHRCIRAVDAFLAEVARA